VQLLSALLVLLIPNTTANHAITYTNTMYADQPGLKIGLVYA